MQRYGGGLQLAWESETGETGDYEWTGEEETFGYGETEGVFDEAEEMELAAQLLEVTDEYEMDQFIGNLFNRARRTVGQFVRSPAGKALGGMLRNAARQALPAAGAAIGAQFGSPQVGSQLATVAGQMFGLELEGMSAEDQEFEAARGFVRFAGDAIRNAAQGDSSTSPQAAARNAFIAAAQQYAPGLLRQSGQAGRGPQSGIGGWGTPRRTGRWIRRGNRIILYGI